MSFEKALARQCLADGDLRKLFIDVLGWDRHSGYVGVPMEGTTYRLEALAQKRGMVSLSMPGTGRSAHSRAHSTRQD
jgi:hypothetical protein